MKKTVVLTLLASLLLVSCQDAKKSEPKEAPKKPVVNQEINDPTLAMITNFSKENGDMAMIALIEKNGKTNDYTAGYTSIDKTTKVTKNDLFEIGSVSKIFTAVAIMQLIEKGDLSLDTRLDTIYPTGDIKSLANYEGNNYSTK